MAEIDLQDRFPELEPINKAPSMGRVNGVGTGLYGSRDFDEETGTYVKTHCISFLFIPVFAIGAYRVADAEGGGWYFIGKEPISPFARMCNLVIPLLAVVLIGGGAWIAHIRSDEYVAEQKLAEANERLAAGEVLQAAQLLDEVARGTTSHAMKAHTQFEPLLTESMDQAPPADQVEVLKLARKLQQERSRLWGPLWGADILPAAALGVVERYFQDHPDVVAAAAEQLEQIEFPPNKALLEKRRKVLQDAAEAHPGHVRIAGAFAGVLAAKGEFERCKEVLVPLEMRLGSTPGARILGRIYVQEGEFEKAEPLLKAYTKAHIDKLHAAEADFESALKRIQSELDKQINSGEAEGFPYEEFAAASEQQKGELYWNYVGERMKGDSRLAAAQAAITEHADVSGVALDLGMTLLRQAQQLDDPAARTRKLEEAEKTFLSIQVSQGGSDEYRLYLGQVYYWLGKQEEGHKLFDAVLEANGRSFERLMQVARSLRNVGAESEAITLIDEAYQAGDEQQKHAAAAMRAVMTEDLDERLTWLARCDQNKPEIRARLSEANGEQAVRDGDDDAAAEHFRTAIAAYHELPENAPTLNNVAGIHFQLFSVTGQKSDFDESLRKMRKAVTLEPENGILIGNTASMALQSAILDIVGDRIDLTRLKRSANLDLLRVLYYDHKQRAALIEQVRKHPEVREAIANHERVLVIAPKRPNSYEVLHRLYGFFDDEAALKRLRDRILEADLDQESQLQSRRDVIEGKDLEKTRSELVKAVVRQKKTIERAREAGGVTLAVALADLVQQQIAAKMYGEAVDLDELVASAREAHAAAPSVMTDGVLVMALLTRAMDELRDSDERLKPLSDAMWRSHMAGYLAALLAGLDDGGDAELLKHKDVAEVVQLSLQEQTRFPDGANCWDWAMLRHTHPDVAAELAEQINQDEGHRIEREIALLLQPIHSSVFDVYWEKVIDGDASAAKKVLSDAAGRGFPVPEFLNDG